MIINKICKKLGHKQYKKKILHPIIKLDNGDKCIGAKLCFCKQTASMWMESELR